ncbi:1,4-alpha-glucan branching protein GlgB [Bdellovibrio sp. SKB1291214]|uniref:1,4-alpha-glucan branching protein GlgB n=1 Tax=Bdellovibrio sp. SKB1291214 TaxID=1732569 RepID=UPI000B51B3AF|nr:1,4-alpha-glucan branching protein GlgB [Bdellovibrio sp. SKB1291214]UYL09624.1 1,4-alpha-glucan branching protein GlgB [Bdellovibrio sp. SKB1291214]
MDTLLTSDDIYLFNEGTNYRSYLRMGAHLDVKDGAEGTWFSVWAPGAKEVHVTGDFNYWNREQYALRTEGTSGVWSGFVPQAVHGHNYKFIITSPQGHKIEKADPYAFYSEEAPKTASKIWNLDYQWQDQEWMENRKHLQNTNQGMSIYEIHLGSWRRNPEQGGRSLTYRELAEELPRYVKDMGFSHVEFMPIMEHPFYGSWGYQTTGYFAPTCRYGTPQDLMYLIDRLHQENIGVIMDWVPSHFPEDSFALSRFNGTHLFEHEDPRLGFHPDWNSLIFNYGRHEVRSFLISSAIFWLEKYHVDGLRVDAVASMLYLDYSRKTGEWIPNRFGGRENIEAIEFLKDLNEAVYSQFPDVHTIAEESTAWPKVSAPTYAGGLGFGMKWDMGWMHDTFEYFRKNSIHRRHHQNQLTFRMMYAFNENFILSISHDEVVYGKGSVYEKMSGDEWQKFANLRALYSYMYAMPGKKLLFMGCEFAQKTEWNHDGSLDWHLTQEKPHAQIQSLIKDLNHVYRQESALHELDFSAAGFEWLDASDANNSVFSFFRRDGDKNTVLCIFNLTPIPRYNYEVGVDQPGIWKEILNSDAEIFGGSGHGNFGEVTSNPQPAHGRQHSLMLTLPPLSGVYFKYARTVQ